MGNGGQRPIRGGDRAFILRLVAAAALVLVGSLVLFDVLDGSNVGGCAARGFQQVTDTPSSD